MVTGTINIQYGGKYFKKFALMKHKRLFLICTDYYVIILLLCYSSAYKGQVVLNIVLTNYD